MNCLPSNVEKLSNDGISETIGGAEVVVVVFLLMGYIVETNR